MNLLCKLSGWPPQGGGGPYDTRKADFASNPESVTLKRVNRIVGSVSVRPVPVDSWRVCHEVSACFLWWTPDECVLGGFRCAGLE